MQRLTDVLSTNVADAESGSLKELDCELGNTITSMVPCEIALSRSAKEACWKL